MDYFTTSFLNNTAHGLTFGLVFALLLLVLVILKEMSTNATLEWFNKSMSEILTFLIRPAVFIFALIVIQRVYGVMA